MLFGPAVGHVQRHLHRCARLFCRKYVHGRLFPGIHPDRHGGGLIWGFWLYPNKPTLPRIIGAKVCINLFCNIGLNTLWLTITGGKAMSVLLAARIPKNILMLPIEIPLAYIVLRQVSRIYQYSFKEN